MKLSQSGQMDWLAAAAGYAALADPGWPATSWHPVDVGDVLASGRQGPRPNLVSRTDGSPLLYSGKIHSVAGTPGSGKSWIALAMTAQMLQDGHTVTYIDFEDSPEGIIERLTLLGVSQEVMKEQFGYVQPQEPLPRPMDLSLEVSLDASSLVVMDGVTNSMQLEGLDPLNNRDASEWMQNVVRPLSSHPDTPAVLLIDHVPKNPRNQKSPVGAQHKLAAVQVQFLVTTQTPFDIDNDGRMKLQLVKDRYGHLRQIAQRSTKPIQTIADVNVRHEGQGEQKRLIIDFEPPGRLGIASVSRIRDATIAFLSSKPGKNRTEIKRGVLGKDSAIKGALDDLIDQGVIHVDSDEYPPRHYLSVSSSDGPAPL
jgi:hypothetical protein